MSQPSSTRTHRKSLLFKSASLIGSLALLSSSLVWTQARADETVATPDAVPTASEAAAPLAQPSAIAPTPAHRLAPIEPTQSFSPRKTSVSRNSPPSSPAALAAPQVSASPRSASIQRQESTLQTLPTQVPTIPSLSRQGQNSFIDTASYNQDKPPRLTAPTQVVLTERSSGCQAVSQNGQLVGGNCGQVMPKRVTLASLRTAPPRAIAQNPRPLNTYSPQEARNSLTVARSSLNQNLSQKAIAVNILRTHTVMNQVVGMEPIARRGLNIALESITEYNRATNNLATGNLATNPTYEATPLPQNHTDLLFPLPVLASISSAFGWRVHPVTGTTRMHEGTDLAAAEGTPVLAAYPGEVAAAEYSGGYGLMVILRHLNGEQESRYGHLSEIFVRPGETVQQGAVIGLVGSTGLATGPHLHFEWRHLTKDGWVAVDAGQHLEWAMANLMQSMRVAQIPKQPSN